MLAVIVLAGGSGSRFGAPGNKVYAELDGRPVLAHSLAVFARRFDHIVIVHKEGERDEALAAAAAVPGGYGGRVSVVAGGATRTASERSGVEALRSGIAAGEVTYVAVHDGARPYLTADLLDRLTAAVVGRVGAIPGIEIDGLLSRTRNGRIVPLDPAERRAVQTPQVFEARALLAAFDGQPAAEGVDTAAIVLAAGETDVVVIPGEAANRKITFATDLGS